MFVKYRGDFRLLLDNLFVLVRLSSKVEALFYVYHSTRVLNEEIDFFPSFHSARELFGRMASFSGAASSSTVNKESLNIPAKDTRIKTEVSV